MRAHEIFLFLYFQESDKTHFKRLLSKIFKANILIESIFNDWLIWNETNWYKFKDLKKRLISHGNVVFTVIENTFKFRRLLLHYKSSCSM